MKHSFYIISVLLCLCSLCGCRSVRYVPSSSSQDTTYVNKLRVDSVYRRDSIYIREHGDTVMISKDHYIYRYSDRTDTLYISKRDTINMPVPVERNLSIWEQVKIKYGGYSLLIVLVFIITLILKMKK